MGILKRGEAGAERQPASSMTSKSGVSARAANQSAPISYRSANLSATLRSEFDAGRRTGGDAGDADHRTDELEHARPHQGDDRADRRVAGGKRAGDRRRPRPRPRAAQFADARVLCTGVARADFGLRSVLDERARGVDRGAMATELDRAALAGSGSGNTGRTAVLENGMEWVSMGMTAEDAQLLESRKFSVAEIARIFRVPPPMIGDLERATFANVTELTRSFAVHTLSPWLSRWEAAIERQLLTQDERRSGLYVEFSLDGLLRRPVSVLRDRHSMGDPLAERGARLGEPQRPRRRRRLLQPLNMQGAGGEGAKQKSNRRAGRIQRPDGSVYLFEVEDDAAA